MLGDIKPREQWNTEDRLDYLEGWHEASDLGFKAKRDAARKVRVLGEDGKFSHIHPAADLMALGRRARVRHAQETGI